MCIYESKNGIRIVLVTAMLLMAPLLAVQFTDEVRWDLADCIVIGTLLIGTGLLYELGVKKLRSSTHRIIFTAVLIAIFLLIWAELAVGVFGTPFGGE